jgi:outer membrane immunogenic protein
MDSGTGHEGPAFPDRANSWSNAMRWIGGVAALAVLALAPQGAMAADLMMSVPVSTHDSLPVADDSGFDWNGFYAGIYGVGQFSPVAGSQYGLGLDIGANAQFDFVLVGAEFDVQALGGGNNGTGTYAQVIGKGGLVATDNLVLYAAGGYGLELGGDESDALLGGGVELAVSDDLSLRAQYLHGFALDGDNPKDQVTIGANFHF